MVGASRPAGQLRGRGRGGVAARSDAERQNGITTIPRTSIRLRVRLVLRLDRDPRRVEDQRHLSRRQSNRTKRHRYQPMPRVGLTHSSTHGDVDGCAPRRALCEAGSRLFSESTSGSSASAWRHPAITVSRAFAAFRACAESCAKRGADLKDGPPLVWHTNAPARAVRDAGATWLSRCHYALTSALYLTRCGWSASGPFRRFRSSMYDP